jgi:hypothetical protein
MDLANRSGITTLSTKGGKHLTIGPELTKEDFLLQVGSESSKLTQTIDLNSYRLKARADGHDYFVDILFKKQNLLSLTLLADSSGEGWTRLHNSMEQFRQKEYNDLLKVGLGLPPYSYSWGEITAFYDPRDDLSFIQIKYRN